MNKKYSPAAPGFNKSVVVAFCIVLFICLNTSIHSVSAQEPSGAADTPEKANFHQIQKSFNDYWKGRKVTKGSGYKPFKRWEWYWESRVNPDGTFPPNNVVVSEWEKYANTYLTDNTADTAANWTFMGPGTTSGGYAGMGRVNCMAFDPKDKNTFWVGTPSGGLWK
ncbi:MAG: hypothetical protein ACOYNU_12580, partial [Bacteroidales bacterium]